MKFYFLKRNNESRLLLFFAGWGMDYHVFPELEAFAGDVCICYDYTDMAFDETRFAGYRSVRLVAWSMGVWAASFVLQNKKIAFEEKIAVNGTLYPVSRERGIIPEIYDATRQMLNERSLQKFYRRMCRTQALYDAFMEKRPRRDLDSLREELTVIGQLSAAAPTPQFEWDTIFIGTNDLIFTTANQQQGWQETGKYRFIPAAHYLCFDFVL